MKRNEKLTSKEETRIRKTIGKRRYEDDKNKEIKDKEKIIKIIINDMKDDNRGNNKDS